MLDALQDVHNTYDRIRCFLRQPLILAIASLLPLSAAIAAQPVEATSDPRIDLATGRQIAVWPPDRHFDHLDMQLELDIPDMSTAYLRGKLTLLLTPVGSPRTQLILDSAGPMIASVTCDGEPCNFLLVERRLTIHFPQPKLVASMIKLVIEYDLDFSKNKGEGLTYSPAISDAQDLTRASPQIHAQGQAQLNSRWFPTHDFPNERLTSRLIVTVEEGFDVISNGRLVTPTTPTSNTTPITPGNQGEPRRRWDWIQDKPHAPYLVTLVIGKLAVIELGGDQSARPGLSMTVHAPYGTEERIKDIFSATPEMVTYFEKIFQHPYPWDRYAQCIVRDFNAGGMENTSCTLLGISASKGKRGAQDALIAHELAHQWFGDLVTCNSWEHIWLNEGWASFSEALWSEHVAGRESPEKARAAYQKTILGFFASQRFRNKSAFPQYSAMVSNRYTNPESVFSKPEDPYAKGAMVLHMLRQRLGDRAFFAAAAEYLRRYRLSTARTEDFRRILEELSGQSLEQFFDQWALRPGLPRLNITMDWLDEPGRLSVTIKQTQIINSYNPAFALSIPLRLKFGNGSVQWVNLDTQQTEYTTTFSLKAKPTQVAVDPAMTLIAPSEVVKDIAWWIDEAINPPSYAAGESAREALTAALEKSNAIISPIAAGLPSHISFKHRAALHSALSCK